MKLSKSFIEDIRQLIGSARVTVARGVDLVQVHTNFEIGRRNLAYMRTFFLLYRERSPILQSAIAKLPGNKKSQSLPRKSPSPTRPFTLSWTHYLILLGIKNRDERRFYEIEAAQQDWTVGEELFFVDLVFYNGLLHCYVLIDLKIGRLTHQDLGQMQMYVNYFDRHVRNEAENATIGIVLCKKRHEAMVEITLPDDANIHTREYQLYLPSKEELRQKLEEWAGEVGNE